MATTPAIAAPIMFADFERVDIRVGTIVEVLIESVDEAGIGEGRAPHQGPDDAATIVRSPRELQVGQLVIARIVDTEGADLVGDVL